MAEIKLSKDQEEHVSRLRAILELFLFCFDMAMMGLGKTYVGSFMLRFFKYGIVACPANMEGKWQMMKEKYELTNLVIISYDALRSIKNKQPKHGLLFRFDIDDVTEYVPTERYLAMVKGGVLLIIDECQRLKNTSGQHHAIKALMKPICTERTKSRALIISGSPVDEQDCVINLLRMTYMIKHRMLKVYHKESRHLELFGAQELIDFAKEVDEEKAHAFVEENKITNKNVEIFCYNIFQQVIKPKLTSTMPIRHAERFSDIYDGYYNLPKADSEMLARSITNLGNVVRYNPRTKTINYDSKSSLGAITKCLMAIEASKLGTFARLAYDALEADKNIHVVLGVNYRASISELKRIFTILGYEHLVIEGSVTKSKREEIMEQFQKRDSDVRLLFANISTIAEGIDLDDKHGDRKRVVFLMPNYSIITLYQVTARFARVDTKSTPEIRFVYGKCGLEERSILNALARKNKVMEDTLQQQVEAGIKFPGSYDKKIEEDIPGYSPGEYPTYDMFKINIEKFMSGTKESDLEDEMGKMNI